MLQYPLLLSFKLLAVAPQIRVTDPAGRLVAFVREKILALKDSVTVFADEDRQIPIFTIRADRIIDFGAAYAIRTADGQDLGVMQQHGLRSLWRAWFDLKAPDGAVIGLIREENPWIKVIDGLVRGIPLVGPLIGIYINPAYRVELNGVPALYVRKLPSFFDRRFAIEKCGSFSDAEEELMVNAVLMMVLLEHHRG